MTAERASRADCEALAAQDPALAAAFAAVGVPVWRRRTPGFPGLARIVIEQQLSVPSANAVLSRADAALDGLSPGAVLAAVDETFRAAGLSRPKIRYLRALASACEDGSLDFEGLRALPDEEAMAALTGHLGVGPWTAAVYLLFCEGRGDLWPRRDVALLAAYRAAGAPETDLPTLDVRAEARFAPHRGTAAHLLWSYLAQLKGRAPL